MINQQPHVHSAAGAMLCRRGARGMQDTPHHIYWYITHNQGGHAQTSHMYIPPHVSFIPLACLSVRAAPSVWALSKALLGGVQSHLAPADHHGSRQGGSAERAGHRRDSCPGAGLHALCAGRASEARARQPAAARPAAVLGSPMAAGRRRRAHGHGVHLHQEAGVDEGGLDGRARGEVLGAGPRLPRLRPGPGVQPRGGGGGGQRSPWPPTPWGWGVLFGGGGGGGGGAPPPPPPPAPPPRAPPPAGGGGRGGRQRSAWPPTRC